MQIQEGRNLDLHAQSGTILRSLFSAVHTQLLPPANKLRTRRGDETSERTCGGLEIVERYRVDHVMSRIY